ncbi:MAG: ribosome recycling factor [Patescibacteria group bacterium]
MYQKIIGLTKQSMEKSFQFFKNELLKIRAGRAQASLVADLLVDYYGTKTLLKQLATISCPELRLILISPFDKNSIKEIEKAVLMSAQKLTAQNDGRVIRVPIPPLTEERRQEVAQIVSQKLEETKQTLRNVREEAWKQIKEMEEAKQISEDDKFRAKDKLDKLIDEYNKKAQDLAEKKKEEVMKI